MYWLGFYFPRTGFLAKISELIPWEVKLFPRIAKHDISLKYNSHEGDSKELKQ